MFTGRKVRRVPRFGIWPGQTGWARASYLGMNLGIQRTLNNSNARECPRLGKKKKVQPGGNITLTDVMKEIKEGANVYLLT